MAKAYQTTTGAVLATAITAIELETTDSFNITQSVLIYTGSKAHVFFNGTSTDAQAMYNALVTDLALTVTTSADL